MTPYELRAKLANTESKFFSKENMAHAGDTMKNYGCRKVQVRVQYDADDRYIPEGEVIDAWELYRKNPVKYGNTASAYFRADTCEMTFIMREPKQ